MIIVPGSKTQQQFLAFHAANPYVYDRLVEISRRLKAKGLKRYAIAGVFEVARYESYFSTTGGDYKMPNVFKPWYSRLIMEQEPDLEGFFALNPTWT